MADRAAGVDVPRTAGLLIAVDGVHADTLVSAARRLAGQRPRAGTLSVWDASGVFAELAVADDAAGRPSVRTLLLLYASDLAYRLRSEVLPALALGHDVIVAPYVETALAFSRIAGVDSPWIADIFAFAPRPALRYYVPGDGKAHSERQGFVELASRKLFTSAERGGALLRETDCHLRGLARLTGAVVL